MKVTLFYIGELIFISTGVYDTSLFFVDIYYYLKNSNNRPWPIIRAWPFIRAWPIIRVFTVFVLFRSEIGKIDIFFEKNVDFTYFGPE
jgi:hypothetical protein